MTIAAALGLGAVFGLVAVKLRLPALVGYLVAGVILGPATPGIVADVDLSRQLAEIGVMLLMFGVGLHFSFSDLLAVKSIALPGAARRLRRPLLRLRRDALRSGFSASVPALPCSPPSRSSSVGKPLAAIGVVPALLGYSARDRPRGQSAASRRSASSRSFSASLARHHGLLPAAGASGAPPWRRPRLDRPQPAPLPRALDPLERRLRRHPRRARSSPARSSAPAIRWPSCRRRSTSGGSPGTSCWSATAASAERIGDALARARSARSSSPSRIARSSSACASAACPRCRATPPSRRCSSRRTSRARACWWSRHRTRSRARAILELRAHAQSRASRSVGAHAQRRGSGAPAARACRPGVHGRARARVSA